MELQQSVSSLQEEVKLLKGEIKAVLKEIRTAVLSNDNPFALDPSATAALTRESPDAAPSASGPSASEAPADPTPAPEPQPEPKPEPPREPVPIRPTAAETEPPAPPQPSGASERRWSLLTVAGLLLWAEDAVATLGAERLRIVLELAAFAELLPPGARDVLKRVADVAPVRPPDEGSVNVIDCVVVLHQLDAILQGETDTRLPRHRELRLHRAA